MGHDRPGVGESAPGRAREALAQLGEGVFLPSLLTAGAVGLAFAAQLHPVTAAIYAGVAVLLTRMRKGRRQVFAEEFRRSGAEASAAVLESDDFARAAWMAIEAASKASAEEKIRLIARLLGSSVKTGIYADSDVLAQYFRLTDALSVREVVVLSALDQHGFHDYKAAGDNVQAYVDMRSELGRSLEMSREAVDVLFDRLQGMGLVRDLRTMDGGARHWLSPLYFDWKQYVQKESGHVL